MNYKLIDLLKIFAISFLEADGKTIPICLQCGGIITGLAQMEWKSCYRRIDLTESGAIDYDQKEYGQDTGLYLVSANCAHGLGDWNEEAVKELLKIIQKE